MKLFPKDLNSGPYLPHLINIYIYNCGVTIALKICGGYKRLLVSNFLPIFFQCYQSYAGKVYRSLSVCL